MKNIFYLCLVAFSFSLTSCDVGDEPEIEGVVLQEMCGEWWVEFLADNGSGELVDIYNIGYNLITTFNTASNSDTEMWISDEHHIWDFKLKVNSNLGAKTFNGDANSVVEGYTINVKINDGKIIEDGATTTGGNTADLISFEAEFEDDPGTIYTLRGYKRTGFLEDEH